MEGLIALLQDRFVIGLLAGLMIAFFVALSSWASRRRLVNSLVLDIEMRSKGTNKILEELEKLRTQNENLRITIVKLKGRPKRAELRQLYVYDSAVRLCNARIPGFGIVWEATWGEAEIEMNRVDSGLLAWPQRFLRSLRPTTTTNVMPAGRLTIEQQSPSAQDSKK